MYDSTVDALELTLRLHRQGGGLIDRSTTSLGMPHHGDGSESYSNLLWECIASVKDRSVVELSLGSIVTVNGLNPTSHGTAPSRPMID